MRHWWLKRSELYRPFPYRVDPALVAPRLTSELVMARTTTLLDDAFTRTVGRLPAWAAFAAAGLIYVGFGLALPYATGTTTLGHIVWNVFGVAWGWAIIVTWLFSNQQRLHRRFLIEWSSDLRRLSATEFEWLVGEVMRREGWNINETGRADAADGNIDLRASRNGRRVVVQCKQWQSKIVGVDEVRKLAGTVASEGLPNGSGVFVTFSRFSGAAVAEARRTGIELVDGRDLIHRLERVRGTEPCTECGEPMILDRSPHGWWLRCSGFPGCRGKRDLHVDPGVAVDLLLAPPTRT
jgi:Restriction endonuclease